MKSANPKGTCLHSSRKYCVIQKQAIRCCFCLLTCSFRQATDLDMGLELHCSPNPPTMKCFYFLIAALTCSMSPAFAQNSESLWSRIGEAELEEAGIALDRVVMPEEYSTLRLDQRVLQGLLETAPEEGTAGVLRSTPLEILLPDGGKESFYITEYSMMEPGLAAEFPAFRTFYGYGVKDRLKRIRLDWTSAGFNAMLSLPDGAAFVKPYVQGDVQHYLSYYERDFPLEAEPFQCGTLTEKLKSFEVQNEQARAGDCQLRTYRLAVATTGEFSTSGLGATSAGAAGDISIVTAHIVTHINQINGWYERDVSVRLVLIANLSSTFYFNGATDPFDNSNSSGMLSQNSTNMSTVIGNGNFDIGHVLGLGAGGSGVAFLNAVCGTNKAGGVTMGDAPAIAGARYIKVWAHEMGHQFGAGHTQNEDCQRSSASAMEPGSGSTIMSYVTSACANQVQPAPDYYFHGISIQQMASHAVSTSCAAILPSANVAPTVTPGLDYTVPASTPLRLNAVATDPNGNALTYTWEQFNNDVAPVIPPVPTNAVGPNFRSFPPTSSSERYLPSWTDIRNATTPIWEVLPSVSRTMAFRVTVRDNSSNSIACTAEDNIVITSVGGPAFAVTAPSGASTAWLETTTQLVSWNVAGSNAAPVSCATVDVLLSYDGGVSYPVTLATGVPNSGSANVVVPIGATSSARVLVRCASNIFFNVSAANFQIQVATSPTFTMSIASSSSAVCAGAVVEIPVSTQSVLGFSGGIALSILNLPAGSTAGFGLTSVPAGSGTMLTIGHTAALAPGTYPFIVVATSGSIQRTANYVLTINEPAGTTTLSTPSNNAMGVSSNPILRWVAKANASSYQVELSTNASFSGTLISQSITTNSLPVVSGLQPLTNYFWRVRATTPCGITPWSSTFIFSTANCLPRVTNSTPVAISGTGTPVITSTINVTTPGIISDLTVSNVTGTHTYTGDLEVELIGPGGTPIVTLWDGLCGSNNDFSLSLSDAAATGVANAPCSPLGQSGVYRPQQPLSAFAGLSTLGVWTLRVSDNANVDGGQLSSWSIDFCVASSVPLPVELIAFSAKPAAAAIQLDWLTASESNNAGFVLERRSEKESDFRELGKVAASDAATAQKAYSYTDKEVRPGIQYYYRLQQLDLDGQVSYSDIKAAKLTKAAGAVVLSPNPARSEVQVQLEEADALEVRLFDVSGRLVQRVEVQQDRVSLDVSGLPRGIYLVKVSHAEGESVERLVID